MVIDVAAPASEWADLAHLVDQRWRHRAPACDGVERRLPDSSVVLLLNLDADRLSWAPPSGDPAWRRVSGAAIAAPLVGPVLLDRVEQRDLVGIELRVGAALPLFGLPASALAEPLVALEDVMGSRARTWYERVAAAASTDTASVGSAVAELLRECVAASGASVAEPGLPAAVRALSRGARIQDVVVSTGLSTSTFNRHIHAATGLRPKQHGRLARLRRVIHHLEGATDGRRRNLTDVAHMTGFTDLAHLSREFTSLTGMTPTAYARSGAHGYHVPHTVDDDDFVQDRRGRARAQ